MFNFDPTDLIANLTNWVEVIGYVAVGLTIATYSMKTMIPLRISGIGANILFILFGYFAPVYPQLILHSVLLPLNIIRLRQMLILVEQVKSSADSDLSMDWLHPFTSKHRCKKGDLIFKKDDPSTAMYYTLSGSYILEEIGVEVGAGQVVGEMGMVSPNNLRSLSLKCKEAGEMLIISYDHVKELYFQNPQFGFYFLNLITKRLIANNSELTKRLEKRST
jgi:CRP/FNR family cyclic AMP-dependent transcriptional regulator